MLFWTLLTLKVSELNISGYEKKIADILLVRQVSIMSSFKTTMLVATALYVKIKSRELLFYQVQQSLSSHLFLTLQVVITQMNGVNHLSESIHVFHVGRMRIKLCKGKTTVAKEYFSASMQVFYMFFLYVITY